MKKFLLLCVMLMYVLPASCKLPGTTKRPSAEDAKTGEYKTVPIEERFRESLK